MNIRDRDYRYHFRHDLDDALADYYLWAKDYILDGNPVATTHLYVPYTGDQTWTHECIKNLIVQARNDGYSLLVGPIYGAIENKILNYYVDSMGYVNFIMNMSKKGDTRKPEVRPIDVKRYLIIDDHYEESVGMFDYMDWLKEINFTCEIPELE